jgi:ATP-dependent RNA helicase DHX29
MSEPMKVASTQPSTSPSSPTQTSLFQSLDSSPPSDESDSASEPDLTLNTTWAELMLELDTLKMAAGQGRGKGKKGKSNPIILESSELRRLKDRIGKIEKEYLFSRKDAGKYDI